MKQRPHHCIALVNQKGGCGKTTTAVNLAAGLAIAGYRVALVDMDSQCNATSSFGLRPEEIVDAGRLTVADMLIADRSAVDCLIELRGRMNGNLAIIPGNRGLGSVPQRLETALHEVMYSRNQSDLEADELRNQHRYRLRNSLRTLDGRVDVVVIDTPPELGFLLTASLLACHSYIIPLKPSGYDLSGLDALSRTVRRVKQSLNPGLSCAGVLQTMVDGRANLDQQIRQLLVAKFGQDLVFQVNISSAVAHRQATVEGQTIFELAPESKAAEQYVEFTREVIRRIGLQRQPSPGTEPSVEITPRARQELGRAPQASPRPVTEVEHG